ncbi:MAG: hypothetical protein AMXMBFR13_27820 [Phycisphaerae bacterium]
MQTYSIVRFPWFPCVFAAAAVAFAYTVHEFAPPYVHSAPVVCVITASLATLLIEYVRRQANRVHAAMAEVRSYARRLEEEVEHRKRTEAELLEAKQAAEKADQAKSRFLAAVSHELRTPLTPVLAMASHWQDRENLPEGLREDFDMIQRNVELQARLIDDLLDWSRISNGKLSLRLERVDVHALIERTVAMCRPAAESKSVTIITDLVGRRQLEGDPTRLAQVLWNIINNAVKFSSPGGGVVVRCGASDGGVSADRPPSPEGWLRIEISDHGKGIAPELLPHIFVPFEQGGRAVTQHFGGLGLGLAITKHLVEAHGGRITAVSDGPGRGATFTVELPLDQAEVYSVSAEDVLAVSGLTIGPVPGVRRLAG